eukprot:gene16809-21250_t
MIGAEMVTHEGYDVPRETFATFFSVIRDAVEEVLGAEWTPKLSGAWAEMLAEIDHFAQQVPRTDVVSPYFAPRLEAGGSSGHAETGPEPVMIFGLALALAAQAALPSGALHYFGRTDYVGPGLVCGAAFTFPLAKGETAVLTKSILTVSTYAFGVDAGSFSIFESQYTTPG